MGASFRPLRSTYNALAGAVRAGLVLVLLGLTGCISLSEMTGIPNPFDVARPFEGQDRNPLAVRGITRGASIALTTLGGLVPQRTDDLAKALIAAAQARDIPLMQTGAAETADRLAGIAGPVPGSMPGTLEAIWTLSDHTGVRIAQFTVQGRDTGGLAQATAQMLQTILEAAQGRLPAAANMKRQTIVLPVTGAPGDGNRILPRILAGMIDAAGFPAGLGSAVATDLRPGTVQIAGQVGVTPVPGDPSTEQVQMTWQVLDHAGRVMGTVAQQNLVPAGLLDGGWGDNAVFAAQGALDGIMDLLANPPGARP